MGRFQSEGHLPGLPACSWTSPTASRGPTTKPKRGTPSPRSPSCLASLAGAGSHTRETSRSHSQPRPPETSTPLLDCRTVRKAFTCGSWEAVSLQPHPKPGLGSCSRRELSQLPAPTSHHRGGKIGKEYIDHDTFM